MQIAACQPVSFCLEYNLRQDEHAVTAGAPSIPGSPFRAAGYSTAAQVNVEWRQRRIWPQFYPALSGDGLKFVTAMPTTGDSSSRHSSSKSGMP